MFGVQACSGAIAAQGAYPGKGVERFAAVERKGDEFGAATNVGQRYRRKRIIARVHKLRLNLPSRRDQHFNQFQYCVILLAAVRVTPWFAVLTPLAATYLLLYVAQFPLPRMFAWTRVTDLSYGVYLYAFPIEQGLVYWLIVHWQQLLADRSRYRI